MINIRNVFQENHILHEIFLLSEHENFNHSSSYLSEYQSSLVYKQCLAEMYLNNALHREQNFTRSIILLCKSLAVTTKIPLIHTDANIHLPSSGNHREP